MANNVSPVNFFGPQALGAALAPDAYSQGLQAQQQQAMAQQLMGQGMTPLDPNRSSGRFATRINPLEGFAKMAQTFMGTKLQEKSNLHQALAAREMQRALMGAANGQVPGAQPMAAAGGSSPVGVSDSSASAVGAPWAASSQVQQPAPQPTQQGQSQPNYLQVAAVNALYGPEAAKLAVSEQTPTDLQRNIAAAKAAGSSVTPAEAYRHALNPDLSTRYGIYRDGNLIGGALPINSLPIQMGPNGPQVQMYPGQRQAISDITGAQKAGENPYQTGTTKVPVTLPNGDQLEVNLNATQMHYYNTTGRLPPEIASTIPGMGGSPKPQPTPSPQFPGSGRGAAVPQPAPGPSGGAPVATPAVGRTQTQSENITQQRQTAAGKAVDEQFAKDYVAFTTGGASDGAKQLGQLHDVVKELENPKANLTGPILGHVPDAVKGFTNPQAIAMRERVEEVVQRSLRAILGAQFTEGEGTRLIARAYNPNLPETENAIRVNRLFTQLNQAFEAKKSAAKYFEQNGTLEGWKGRLPMISDFEPDAGRSEGKVTQTVDFNSLTRGR